MCLSYNSSLHKLYGKACTQFSGLSCLVLICMALESKKKTICPILISYYNPYSNSEKN